VSILIGDLAFAFVKNKAIVNRCLTAVLAGAVRRARILGRADYGSSAVLMLNKADIGGSGSPFSYEFEKLVMRL